MLSDLVSESQVSFTLIFDFEVRSFIAYDSYAMNDRTSKSKIKVKETCNSENDVLNVFQVLLIN